MTPWITVMATFARAWEGIPYDPVLYPPEVFASDEVVGGELRVEGGGALVLKHQDVVVEVHAGLARVTMVQLFQNPYDQPLEAKYLLPLPSMAAVDAMELQVGDRAIEAAIMERDAARQAYDDAVADGRRAALLEQTRENLFTQHVSGICPGERVTVTIQYALVVPIEDGLYTLSLPMTVGPRYSPPWVEDAAALETPYGADVPTMDVTVYLDEGMPIEALFSDSHDLVVDDEGTWGAIVRFPDGTLPDRDLELTWSLAGQQPRVSILTNRADPDEDGTLALSFEPQLVDDAYVAQPRELLFVLDESCSMAGEPFEAARAVVLHALGEMGPNDTFNLVKFSSEASSLFHAPQRATAATRAEARAWLSTFEGGGTEMDRGIVHSLTMPGDPESLRLVLMLTDGYIGGEDDMFAVVRKHLGDSRLFALGVGGSTNRYLLEGLAEMGRGDVAYHRLGASIPATVDTFYGRIAHPAMTDITVDWGDLDVHDVYPKRIPDLWAGQPMRLLARFGAAGDGVITVTGTVGDQRVRMEVPVHLPDDDDAHGALPAAWARQRIRDLEWYPGSRTPAQVRAEVTDVALEHHLVSTYTSLVAVDDEPCPCGVVKRAAEVPHVLPAGLSGHGFGMGGGGSAYGLGGLGTRGVGSGGSGYGSGGGNFGAKAEGSIASVGSNALIIGSLDKSVIELVIRQNNNKIRYCYQRALQKDASLAGRLVIGFTITSDGSSDAVVTKSDTLADPNVAACVIKTFQRMTFPAPNGGGTVRVSYPIVFSATP